MGVCVVLVGCCVVCPVLLLFVVIVFAFVACCVCVALLLGAGVFALFFICLNVLFVCFVLLLWCCLF